jgi:hypothetical protein
MNLRLSTTNPPIPLQASVPFTVSVCLACPLDSTVGVGITHSQETTQLIHSHKCQQLHTVLCDDAYVVTASVCAMLRAFSSHIAQASKKKKRFFRDLGVCCVFWFAVCNAMQHMVRFAPQCDMQQTNSQKGTACIHVRQDTKTIETEPKQVCNLCRSMCTDKNSF